MCDVDGQAVRVWGGLMDWEGIVLWASGARRVDEGRVLYGLRTEL